MLQALDQISHDSTNQVQSYLTLSEELEPAIMSNNNGGDSARNVSEQQMIGYRGMRTMIGRV